MLKRLWPERRPHKSKTPGCEGPGGARLGLSQKGDIVFERWGEKDPVFMLKLYAQDRPRAVYDGIENAVIDAGWTNADIRAMLGKALPERKH